MGISCLIGLISFVVVIGLQHMEVDAQCNVLSNGQCSGMGSCRDVKACNRNYGDGEYWLCPKGNGYNKTKIYCHDMANDPKEYITLYKPNKSILNIQEALFPCTWATGLQLESIFRKIRVDVENMTIERNDTTFADVNMTNGPKGNWNAPDYGYGLGCSVSYTLMCQKKGYFLIDTSNTGFIVDPSIKYKAGGHQQVMGKVTRSPDNYRIEVTCDGACGYCFPDGELTLVKSPDEVPPDEAKNPVCD